MSKVVIKRKKANKGFIKGQKGLADKVALVEKSTMKNTFPQFRAGDTLKVGVRIKEGDKERIQAYEGVCIKLSSKGGSKTFTVRKISHGVGVERIFLFTSPKVAKIEVLEQGRVRRAKLYYIRDLEGKAAKIEREVETQASSAASAKASAKK
jgi:large subunit ribosomal protein L19